MINSPKGSFVFENFRSLFFSCKKHSRCDTKCDRSRRASNGDRTVRVTPVGETQNNVPDCRNRKRATAIYGRAAICRIVRRKDSFLLSIFCDYKKECRFAVLIVVLATVLLSSALCMMALALSRLVRAIRRRLRCHRKLNGGHSKACRDAECCLMQCNAVMEGESKRTPVSVITKSRYASL